MQGFAGVSIVDITPAGGLELAGYPHYPRHNTGAHDPLYASCLYLNDGSTRAALVGIDILFFSRRHVLEVRRRASLKTGIPPENIMLFCSHTHSGPWAAGRLDMESLLAGAQQDEAFIEELTAKLTELIVSASRTAFPASIGYQKEVCGKEQGVGGNRRDPDNGPADPYVYTLAVRDEENCLRALFVNYNVHPTLLHADNTLCSADYPGYIRESLRAAHPFATMVFGLGCAGDQSTRYFRQAQSFGEARRIGHVLGDAACRAANAAHYQSDFTLGVRSMPFHPQLRELPAREHAQSRADEENRIYSELESRGASYLELQNANVKRLGAEDVLGYVLLHEKGQSMELIDDELPSEIAALRVAGLTMVFLPGEHFCEIGHHIRERTGDENIVFTTLANGALPGYVYTKEEALIGGYEVDTSMLDPATGDLTIESAASLWKELGHA